MKHFKNFASLSNDKWERIQQLEAELDALYQGILSTDDVELVSETQSDYFEYVNDAIIFCGLDSVIKSWNHAATAQSGYTKTEAIGQNIQHLLHATPLHTTWDEVEATLRKQEQWQGEITNHHKDGHEMIVEATISPLLNEEKVPVGIFAIQRDVTERYQREQVLEQRIEKSTQELEQVNQQLQTSQQWYQALIRNFPNGIVGLINQDLRFEIMGGEGEIVLPYQGDDLAGRRLADIMPPEIVKRDEPSIKAALQGEGRVQTVDYQNGKYRVHTVPITDDDGNVLSAMVMSQDITELVRAKEQIEANEERYRMLFHSIPDMVFILNRDMDFVLVNQTVADFLNMSTDAIQDQNITSLVEGIEDSVFYENYMLSLSDGHPRVVVGQFSVKGSSNWYEARLLPIQDGLLVIKRDITLQRKLNQKALETEVSRARNHTRDEIVHNLAHDLRTPLATINTSLYLLENYTDPDKQKQKVGSLKRQVGHLHQMIENILLLTELDTYQPADLIRVDIRQLIVDLASSYQSRAEQKNLDFSYDVPDDPLYHVIQSEHLVHALKHVLDNAFIYSKQGGSVHVTLAQTAPNSFTISVQDTGIGISTEHLPHIFERFYRADAARTMNEAGIGLGLTIAQQIIELHNGHIVVSSQPDKGTKVTIVI